MSCSCFQPRWSSPTGHSHLPQPSSKPTSHQLCLRQAAGLTLGSEPHQHQQQQTLRHPPSWPCSSVQTRNCCCSSQCWQGTGGSWCQMCPECTADQSVRMAVPDARGNMWRSSEWALHRRRRAYLPADKIINWGVMGIYP